MSPWRNDKLWFLTYHGGWDDGSLDTIILPSAEDMACFIQ